MLVTHEPFIAEHTQRVIILRDGRITEDKDIAEPKNAREELAVIAAERKEGEA
jgi:putative ABC transport system ATP-binding protein